MKKSIIDTFGSIQVLSEKDNLVTNFKFYRRVARLLKTQREPGFLFFQLQEALYV